MSDVTGLLDAVDRGEPQAADRLLPLVYDELRRLAAARMANERAGHTLEATALVHEAYVRLVGPNPQAGWKGRGHFFAAAAEAMRRILVENARRKKGLKHGGDRRRVKLGDAAADGSDVDLLDLDAALERLEALSPPRAALVKLRFFAGFTMPQAAEALGISLATAERQWAFARAWLFAAVAKERSAASS
jgi:RNA polymerase sigma factor (TIGR02999 family)